MQTSTKQIFERYFDQPMMLPRGLRQRIEKACGGAAVEIYAMADLDASMKLCQVWLCLTRNEIIIARRPANSRTKQSESSVVLRYKKLTKYTACAAPRFIFSTK
jgi:hypothetical protein